MTIFDILLILGVLFVLVLLIMVALWIAEELTR